jgi:rhodanese-related sulfurtransferase
MNPLFIDVREADEYGAERIEGSLHIPLSNFSHQAPPLLKCLDGRPVLLVCRSGKRASLAAAEAARFECESPIEVLPGGIEEWIRQGKPVEKLHESRLPLMRQVQLAAGSLVLAGVALSHFVDPRFILLSAFVGTGLVFAGATGFCGMAELLGRMPWNKRRSS